MSNIIQNIEGEIICFLYILSIFIISIPFYKISAEYSRKVIHIMLGFFYFIALLYFTEWYFASFGPFIFIFVNYFSVKYSYIKLMLRNKKKLNTGGYNDYGTVYYAMSLTIITIYSWKINKPEIGICPFLSMAFGDGFAGVFGSSIKSKTFIIFESKKKFNRMFYYVFYLFFSLWNFLFLFW
jgi:dolichol kinase